MARNLILSSALALVLATASASAQSGSAPFRIAETGQEFARLSENDQRRLIAYLNSFVLFPPDDTASTLDPGNRNTFGFPQFGHGSIRLTSLFNNPNDPE